MSRTAFLNAHLIDPDSGLNGKGALLVDNRVVHLCVFQVEKPAERLPARRKY